MKRLVVSLKVPPSKNRLSYIGCKLAPQGLEIKNSQFILKRKGRFYMLASFFEGKHQKGRERIDYAHAFPQQFSGFKTNTHQAVNGSYKYTHLLNQNWFYLNCICSFFVSIVFQRFLIKICDYLTLK